MPALTPLPVDAAPNRASDALAASSWPRDGLDLQTVLLSQTRLASAAQAWVQGLAEQLALDQVTLGVYLRGDLCVVARSNGVAGVPSGPEAEGQRLAMAEALDQSASVACPDPRPAAHPRITLAHRRLLQGRAGTVASVPLMSQGEPIGAVCVERSGPPLSAHELQSLERHATLAGPVLDLMRLNERNAFERVRDAWRSGSGPRTATHRWVGMAGALGFAVLALLPLEWQIGGHARLEGAVQRLLVAPADGFLHKVHARPGERVHAGQVLAELAEQDLLLEQQRWQSQSSQHENAYAAAQARADRAQQVIHQSRAEEAQAQLALVQLKLARGRIEAPFDGVVIQGDLSQSLGAPVSQGSELMTLAPLDRFRVIVEVDERDIAAVAPGQSGTLALSALPWDTQPLRVTRITPTATPMEGRNVFEVEAELLAQGAGQTSGLRPGLQGSAHIAVGRQPLLWSASRRLIESLRLLLWEWWG